MKLFLFLWDCVSDKHKIVSCSITLAMFISAACFIPVPMTTGSVTTARWFYNVWDDHKQKDENSRIASIERDVAALREQRTGREVIGMQLRLQGIQNDRTHVSSNPYLSDSEKDSMIRSINERLERLYRKMDRKGIRLEEIESSNNAMMLANSR